MFKLKCNFTSGFSGANNVCRMAEKNLKKFRRAIKFFITIFRFHLQNFVVDSFHFSLYYFYYADVVIHNIFFYSIVLCQLTFSVIVLFTVFMCVQTVMFYLES